MKTGQTILVGADEAPSFRPMNLTNPKVGVILARFQPIHNGHLALIEKACKENDHVLILIGSSDKLNERNSIPWTIRKELVTAAVAERGFIKTSIEELPDLTDESDNSHDWASTSTLQWFPRQNRRSLQSTIQMGSRLSHRGSPDFF